MASKLVILALYDPLDDDAPLRRPRGPFPATRKGMRFLGEVIDHYNRKVAPRADIWLSLGIFPHEETK